MHSQELFSTPTEVQPGEVISSQLSHSLEECKSGKCPLPHPMPTEAFCKKQQEEADKTTWQAKPGYTSQNFEELFSPTYIRKPLNQNSFNCFRSFFS